MPGNDAPSVVLAHAFLVPSCRQVPPCSSSATHPVPLPAHLSIQYHAYISSATQFIQLPCLCSEHSQAVKISPCLLLTLPPRPLPIHSPHRKDQGNEFYKKGDYRAAIDAYSLAIAEAPDEPSFYGNRAAAHMMILAYESAIEDCDKAIALSPGMVKAYFRKSKALATLGNRERRSSERQLQNLIQCVRPLILIPPSLPPKANSTKA